MKITLPLSIVLTIIYRIQNKDIAFTTMGSNALFIIGLLHLLIGLAVIAKNYGALRAFGFLSYKIANKRNQTIKDDPAQATPAMSYYEFVNERYTKQHEFKQFLLLGIVAIILSIALAFM